MTNTNTKTKVRNTKKVTRISQPKITKPKKQVVKPETESTFYIARIQKNIDSEPFNTTTHKTLAETIKSFPRSARKLSWSFASFGYDMQQLPNGMIVSIERID